MMMAAVILVMIVVNMERILASALVPNLHFVLAWCIIRDRSQT
jgi:hypothetical protein